MTMTAFGQCLRGGQTAPRAPRSGVRQGTFCVCAALTLAACATQPAPPAASSPTPASYEGTCHLVGIEQVAAPAEQEGDSVALVARYRFGEAEQPGSRPWSVQFQVARAREHDLRLHLQANPNVVCTPDANAGAPEPPRIEVPPFDGQHGQPLP